MSDERSAPRSHPQSIAELEAEVRRGMVARREDLKRRAEGLPTLSTPLKGVESRFLQCSIDRIEEEEAALRTIFPDL